MSVLRSLESKLAGLVEGTFSRAFKSGVRPLELARKLARELEINKVESLSRVYAPNEYVVWLSTEDRAHFEAYEDELVAELAGYLLEHARSQGAELLTTPKIKFCTDDRLRLGEFGIQARVIRGQEPPPKNVEVPIADKVSGETRVYTRAELSPEKTSVAHLIIDGKRVALDSSSITVGRSRDCGVVVADSSVSRRHAEIFQRAGQWWIRDLRSTNGIRLNGRDLGDAQQLADGDEIELGSAEMHFELPRE